MTINMRIPTYEEWDKMMNVCDENNDLTYWCGIFSWVSDCGKQKLKKYTRVSRGYNSPDFCGYHDISLQYPLIGFRPAFDNLPPNALENGGVKVIGTLYMNGIPVRVPSNPTYEGDILDYIPGARLEMREPLADPQYQVRAIKVGSTYIADRVLLKNISYEDIVAAIAKADDGQADRGQCEDRWFSVEIENANVPTVYIHTSKEAAVSYANAKLAKIIAQSDVFDSETYHKSDNTKQMLSMGYRNQNNRWDCYLMAETNIEILTQE